MNGTSKKEWTPGGALPTEVRCAVCGGAASKELLRIHYPDRFECALGVKEEGYQRTWRECPNCGAVTNVHDPAVVSELGRIAGSYYEIDFGAKPLAERYAQIMALPASRSDNAGRVQRIRAMVDAWFGEDGLGARLGETERVDRRVLDIGAGLGVFLSGFLREGWTGDAVEPDAKACAHLEQISNGRFGVVQGLYRGQAQFRDYDLVTLNKVVEHLPDPVSLLRSVRPALGRGGVLYVEVPDKLTIGCRPSTDNILGALHYHLYDPRSLAMLFEVGGFWPVQLARVFEPSGKITVFGFAVAADAADQLTQGASS